MLHSRFALVDWLIAFGGLALIFVVYLFAPYIMLVSHLLFHLWHWFGL